MPKRTPAQLATIENAVLQCLAMRPMSASELAASISPRTHMKAGTRARNAPSSSTAPIARVSYEALASTGHEPATGSEDETVDLLDALRAISRGEEPRAAHPRSKFACQVLNPDPRTLLPVFRRLRDRGLIACEGERRGARWRLVLPDAPHAFAAATSSHIQGLR